MICGVSLVWRALPLEERHRGGDTLQAVSHALHVAEPIRVLVGPHDDLAAAQHFQGFCVRRALCSRDGPKRAELSRPECFGGLLAFDQDYHLVIGPISGLLASVKWQICHRESSEICWPIWSPAPFKLLLSRAQVIPLVQGYQVPLVVLDLVNVRGAAEARKVCDRLVMAIVRYATLAIPAQLMRESVRVGVLFEVPRVLLSSAVGVLSVLGKEPPAALRFPLGQIFVAAADRARVLFGEPLLRVETRCLRHYWYHPPRASLGPVLAWLGPFFMRFSRFRSPASAFHRLSGRRF